VAGVSYAPISSIECFSSYDCDDENDVCASVIADTLLTVVTPVIVSLLTVGAAAVLIGLFIR